MADILSIGSSGLTAYRKLLETVGGNIVNANTEGYVRRDVVLSGAGESSMLPTARAGAGGSGVFVESVRRGTDAFLQSQSYVANAASQHASVLADSLGQLERSIFSAGSNAATEVENFFSRFSDLANSPTSTTGRMILLDAGERVASSFRATAGKIETSLASVDSALDAALTEVNSIAAQLASLNGDIRRSAAGGQKPNDLLDQRDRLLTQLSDLTSFAVAEAPNGSIDLYLGETASGQALIGLDGAHQLGALRDGERLDIAYDPYSSPSITSQIRSGAIAGLLAFRSEANLLLRTIDRLAVGFSAAVNSQHRQGIDLDGAAGKDLFSTDTLKPSAGRSNSGDARMTLNISRAAGLTGASYTARFDARNHVWTVKSSQGESVSGPNDLVLDGVTFSFEGRAADGDIFTAEPLKGAAAGMRFLRQTSSELAAAMPLYVDPAIANAGTAELGILQRDGPTPATPLPSAAEIFDGTGANGVDFLRDGAAFFIPAGTQATTLTSLGALSSVRFDATASEILALDREGPGGAGGLNLSIDIASSDPQQRSGTIRLDLAPNGSTLEEIAEAVNAAAQKAGIDRQISAGVSNGALLITGLSGNTVAAGAIRGFNASGGSSTIKGAPRAAQDAAQIRLFTRDGRQLAGPAMSDAEASAFVTPQNGFLSEAIYRPPSETFGYRDMGVSVTTKILPTTAGPGAAVTIGVAGDAAYAQIATGEGAAARSGAVYALDIAGLPDIRLSGDALGTKGPEEVASSLFDRINDLSTRRTWTGGNVLLAASDKAELAFTLTLDGQDHQVTFHRAQRENGDLLATGSFEVSGPRPIEVALVTDAQGSKVMISAPAEMRTGAPAISISADPHTMATLGVGALRTNLSAGGTLAGSLLGSFKPQLLVEANGRQQTVTIDGERGRSGDLSWTVVDGRLSFHTTDSGARILPGADAALLGFDGTEGQGASIRASRNLLAAFLAGKPVALHVGGGAGEIAIDGPSGSQGGVSWSLLNNRLLLSSIDRNIHVSANTVEARNRAASLGFLGADLDVALNGAKITISSTAGIAAASLADTSASTSIVGSTLSFDSAPEDLIVAMDGAAGLRRVATHLGDRIADAPTLPNISVRILSSSELEIFDQGSGVSLANRSWSPDEPVVYLGLTFMITGTAKPGDRFDIVDDRTRAGDNRNALLLAGLATKSIFGPRDGSFQEIYAATAASIGATVASATTTAEAARQSASDLKAAYEAKTGVNLDTEASDLIRYQQAYQAAAQVISSAREMFQTIMNSF